MKKILAFVLAVLMLTAAFGFASAENLREENLVELDVIMMASAGKDGSGDVVDAMNTYLEEKLNVNITLTFISYGNYTQQTNLLLSAGEGVDVLPVYLTPLTTVANNGQILPLNDLLEEYGQGIIEQIGWPNLYCGAVDGEVFGITTGRDLAAAYGFEMRKDICDKYDIDYENITTLEQLHDALAIVHENEPDLVCVVPSNGELIRNWGWDPLGDASVPLGVLMDMGATTEVVNLFETEYFMDFVSTMREWYNEGLIMADGAATTESVGTMMGAGTAFGGFMNLKPYFNVQETNNYGTEIVVSEIIPAFSTTSNVNMATWAIAASTEYPEASMKLLNMMYSDPTLENLMIYGLENTHYVVLGDAANGQKLIGYPEGVNASNTSYRPSGGWLWCNQFIGNVWEGNPADYWDVTREFNETAIKSSAFGFIWDSNEVRNQVSACTNVLNKYYFAVLCGSVEPEETLAAFNAELYAAGLQDIINSKQNQLNAWLEANA